MKKLYFVFICLSVFFVSIACETVPKADMDSGVSDNIMKDISVEEFKSLISEKSIILDVRTKKEFESGHLENAVNIDFFSANFLSEVLKLDNEKFLLIHCASGGRSSKAMKIIEDKGFAALYNMLGGIGEWKAKGFPVVK